MKTNSKHKYQNETEISENDDIVQADQSEPPTQQPSNPDQQVQNQPGTQVPRRIVMIHTMITNSQ